MPLRAIDVVPRDAYVVSWFPSCRAWRVLFGFERGIYDSLDAWLAENGISADNVSISRCSASFDSQLDALLCYWAFREVKRCDDPSGT
jgi:hypothetical protein